MEETVPQQEKKSLNKSIIAITLIVIIATVIIGYEATKPKDETTADASTPATTPKKTEETITETTTEVYENGTYTATGEYTSPGGPESIAVTVVVENDIITEAKVVSNATRPISKDKQAIFIANFKPEVIGKKIDEVKLDKISSSSLTPKGFNDALEKIKEKAKA